MHGVYELVYFIDMSPQHKCKLHVCTFCNEYFCHFLEKWKDLLSRESSEATYFILLLVLPNGMPPLNILLKNDDEILCLFIEKDWTTNIHRWWKDANGNQEGKFQGTKSFHDSTNIKLSIGHMCALTKVDALSFWKKYRPRAPIVDKINVATFLEGFCGLVGQSLPPIQLRIDHSAQVMVPPPSHTPNTDITLVELL